ncbi:MAG TPA: UpxY family transcription antiterminator [Terriglobales bacterium]|nr:UpxY family transcription antiterminator [Terriglobales bacterium]
MSSFSQVPDPAGDDAAWYAVQTRSRHEKKVAEDIQEKGIQSFLPLVIRVHKWSDRQKQVQLPLFPGYVFVHTTSAAPDRISVLRTPGVAGFVGSSGKGTPIPEKQIEDIRLILDRNVPFEDYPFLEISQRVRIRGGSLDGVEGTLVAKNSDQSLVVSIDLIKRSILVRVSGYELERV